MTNHELPIVLNAPEVASLVIALNIYVSLMNRTALDSRLQAHLNNEELSAEGLEGITHLLSTFGDYLHEYKKQLK